MQWSVRNVRKSCFTTALRRKWPLGSGVWNLEFQQRGAAHYHLMLFGLRDEPLGSLRAWIRDTWYRIAHHGDRHLGAAATQVDPILKAGGALAYFTKYLGKGDQTLPGNFSGRYGGKINTARLPAATPKELEVPRQTAALIRRIARNKMRHDANASRWKRHLEHLRPSGWSLSRLQWQTAVSSLRGGAARVPLWTSLPATLHHEDGRTFMIPACELCLKYEREHLRHILATHPPPRPWKPRHNDRLRLLCDASAFLNALARLHQPASSFRVFSKAAP